jgi:hypothetical protein
MWKIWLDDERPAPPGWYLCKTANEAIHCLKSMQHAATNQVLWDFHGMSDFWKISHMSFDHDLADVHYTYFMAGQVLPKDHPQRDFCRRESAKEMTGYDVLLWMAEHEVWPTEACYVHTHNTVRGPIMAKMVNRYGPYETPCRWIPYRPSAQEIADLLS